MQEPNSLSKHLDSYQLALREKSWSKGWKFVTGVFLLGIIFGLLGSTAYNVILPHSNENQPATQLLNLERSVQESALISERELLMMKRTMMWLAEEVSSLRDKVNLIEGPHSELLKPSKGILEELLTQEPDLACEGSGGSVIATPDTLAYTVPHRVDIFWGLHSYTSELPRNPPETTIKGMIRGVGDCWGFRGSAGRLLVRLHRPSRLTAVTVSHIPRSISPSGTILSAPRSFNVLAHKAPDDRGWLLGEFEYLQFGSWRQTFPLDAQAKNELIQIVEFQFLSNYGHPDFTCIYRVHVHGDYSTL